jgi:hypothetical protein
LKAKIQSSNLEWNQGGANCSGGESPTFHWW